MAAVFCCMQRLAGLLIRAVCLGHMLPVASSVKYRSGVSNALHCLTVVFYRGNFAWIPPNEVWALKARFMPQHDYNCLNWRARVRVPAPSGVYCCLYMCVLYSSNWFGVRRTRDNTWTGRDICIRSRPYACGFWNSPRGVMLCNRLFIHRHLLLVLCSVSDHTSSERKVEVVSLPWPDSAVVSPTSRRKHRPDSPRPPSSTRSLSMPSVDGESSSSRGGWGRSFGGEEEARAAPGDYFCQVLFPCWC